MAGTKLTSLRVRAKPFFAFHHHFDTLVLCMGQNIFVWQLPLLVMILWQGRNV